MFVFRGCQFSPQDVDVKIIDALLQAIGGVHPALALKVHYLLWGHYVEALDLTFEHVVVYIFLQFVSTVVEIVP